MKRIFAVLLLVFAALAGWQVGGSLSNDAMSMAVGIFFGILAGVPTALLVLASGRRRGDSEASTRRIPRSNPYAPAAPHQPPVIIITPGAGQGPAGAGQDGNAMGGWDESRPERRFKIVGEREEWIED